MECHQLCGEGDKVPNCKVLIQCFLISLEMYTVLSQGAGHDFTSVTVVLVNNRYTLWVQYESGSTAPCLGHIRVKCQEQSGKERK